MSLLLGIFLGVVVAEPIILLTHADSGVALLIGMACGSLGLIIASTWLGRSS